MNWLLVAAAAVLIVAQRVLRDRRVRARPLAPFAAGARGGAGAAGREARAAPARRNQRVHLDLPGRQHDGLDRHRRASASRRSRTCSSIALGSSVGTRRDRDRRRRRLPADHERADHRRRDGPEALRDRSRGARARRIAAAAAVVSDPLPPVHRRADGGVERDARRARRRPAAPHLARRLARRSSSG